MEAATERKADAQPAAGSGVNTFRADFRVLSDRDHGATQLIDQMLDIDGDGRDPVRCQAFIKEWAQTFRDGRKEQQP